MFAAVSGNIIHIYSVTSFENILNLKGHNGKVSQAGDMKVTTTLELTSTSTEYDSSPDVVVFRCLHSSGAWMMVVW